MSLDEIIERLYKLFLIIGLVFLILVVVGVIVFLVVLGFEGMRSAI